jgi:hypothetical protein
MTNEDEVFDLDNHDKTTCYASDVYDMVDPESSGLFAITEDYTDMDQHYADANPFEEFKIDSDYSSFSHSISIS